MIEETGVLITFVGERASLLDAIRSSGIILPDLNLNIKVLAEKFLAGLVQAPNYTLISFAVP